ncbi:hypothetical protein [Flavobacterium sp.]|uniref:hypothetical protein n=1 Tax=Flavobacterium sp. TaxID=239 RepID=UPI0025BA2A47|nr:hypothetical protein [Flavobacterium sp.]MBA4154338.1 hypothetical protein [Flavobacterium sp.]
MRKSIIIFIISFLFTSCKSTPFVEIKENENAYLIRNNNSIGEVFNKDFESSVIENSPSRFTPSIEEINGAENILISNLKNKNNSKDGRYIFRNLKDYKRQYLGFINSDGDKMLHVSFYLDKNSKKQDNRFWEEEYKLILDGGVSYWIAIINLKTNKLESFAINGIA